MRRHWPALAVLLSWLVTRALVVWLLQGRHGWVGGDLEYFSDSLAAVDELGLARTLVEYPLPGVVVVAVPWLLARLLGEAVGYDDVVLGLSMLADAAFTVLVAVTVRGRRRAALVIWLLAVPLLGATTYARFDLLPGLLVGTALALLASHPRAAAVAAALATGLKLWPAFVLPALAARAASRRTVLLVVAAVGGVLAGLSLVLAGWGRLFSPLAWQADRGLQVEAVAATPPVVGWALFPASFEVVFTEHNAFEVLGPGTTTMLMVSELLSLAALAVLLVLWGLAFRHGSRLDLDTVVWLALAAVGLFVVTSKVLSPQYLLWLLPAAAVAAGVVRSRTAVAWAAVLLVATAATQVVFPELYGHLTQRGEHAGLAVLVLAVRNLLLVLLTGWALAAAVRGVSAAARSRASHPDRTGTTSAPAAGGRPTRT